MTRSGREEEKMEENKGEKCEMEEEEGRGDDVDVVELGMEKVGR